MFFKNHFPHSTRRFVIYLLITQCLLFSAHAQTVDSPDVHEIIQKLSNLLVERYPFPELSQRYRDTLDMNEKAGRYKGLTEQALADAITADLQLAHKDVHLHVLKNEAEYRDLTSSDSKAASEESDTASMKKLNYGFKNVDLDATSSTAYINIPGPFYANQQAFEVAAAAMNMAAYSTYVILDLRTNGGGSGEMGRFLASYFFDAGDEQFYLNGFYKDRSKDEQEWTYSYVPGKRNPKAKVYILVGPGTASASEGLAFAMQKLHRATIVGETTAGAGIAGDFLPLKNNLIVFLPTKMVVAPNTQVGWEGTGVIPDLITTGKDALAETRECILQDVLNSSADPTAKSLVQWLLDDMKVSSEPRARWQSRYEGLPGKYNNDISIISTKDGFIWRKTEADKSPQDFVMLEVKPDIFTVIDLNKAYGSKSTRIYLTRDASGKITNLEKRVFLTNGSIYVVPQLYRLLSAK